MKKPLALCFLLVCTVSLSFAQIFRGEGETRNGTVSFSIHFVEYTGYKYLFHINGVSIFLDDDNMVKLETVLEKFAEWEEMAGNENISITKTIDSITFSNFHYSHTFFKEPLILYFIFTGGPVETVSSPAASGPFTEESAENSREITETHYTLYIDTTLDKITPFRLDSKTIQEMLFALSPDKLMEAREAYERQRALGEMFN